MMSVAPADIGTGQAAAPGGVGGFLSSLFSNLAQSVIGHGLGAMGIPFGGLIADVAHGAVTGNTGSIGSGFGATVGGMVAGPVGAAIGGIAGNAIGNMPGVDATSVPSDPSGASGGLPSSFSSPAQSNAFNPMTSAISGYSRGGVSQVTQSLVRDNTPQPSLPTNQINKLAGGGMQQGLDPLSMFKAGFAVPLGQLMNSPYWNQGA
jgi:hypothetical protein